MLGDNLVFCIYLIFHYFYNEGDILKEVYSRRTVQYIERMDNNHRRFSWYRKFLREKEKEWVGEGVIKVFMFYISLIKLITVCIYLPTMLCNRNLALYSTCC